MEQPTISLTPQTPLELLTRQQGEWKQLKQDLTDKGGSTQEIAYCIAVLENIDSDLELLTLNLL